MSREDIEEHIRDSLAEFDGTPAQTEDEPGPADVALQKLVCADCGAVNGREPRPLDVPDTKTDCPECDDFTVHEYVVDSAVTENVS